MMDELQLRDLKILRAADGEMPDEERAALEQSLEADPEGRRLLREMSVLVRAEKALPQDIPEGLHEFIMDGVAWNRRLDVMQRRAKTRALAAAACAALILVGAGLAGVFRKNGEKSDSASAESVSYSTSTGARNGTLSGGAAFSADAAEEDTQMEETAAETPLETADTGKPAAQRFDDSRSEPGSAPSEGYTPEAIELVLADQTNCHTIVIARAAQLESLSLDPAFEAEGYTAYELTPSQFDALDSAGNIEGAVYFTNHDGAGENILLAVPAQGQTMPAAEKTE